MKNLYRSILLTTTVMLFSTIYGYSQGRGNMAGKVTDETGGTLPGAAVIVKGTTLGTSTDINGQYQLRGIEAREVLITVEYIGYSSVTMKVNIESGKTVNQDFVMAESASAIESVVVSGVVNGQQRALNQQRSADNMMQIMSADQMGRFPDLNVAEALQRLSGVTISRSRGEGAEAQLRGTPASFVNINVNNEQVMGASTMGQRNTSLDVIPSDILSSMEVQKTLLPSNDGDAIAGIINLRTGTARSLKFKGSIDLSTGYNYLRGTMPQNYKAGFSKRFAANNRNPEGRFGIAANASYYSSTNGYDRIEAQSWVSSTIKPAPGTTGQDQTDVYFPTDFRYRYQIGSRNRAGGSLVLDYAPTLNTKFVFNAMYNERRDKDIRYRDRTRLDGATYYDLGEEGIGVDRLRKVTQVTSQDIGIKNLNLNLDGETVFGSWKVDGGLFYTRSRKVANNPQWNFTAPDWRANKKDIAGTDDGKGKPIQIANNTIVGVIPSIADKYLSAYYKFQPAFGGACDDPDRFNLSSLDNNNTVADGRNFTARVNVNRNYFIGRFASTFSFGAKGKFMRNIHEKVASSTNESITAGADTKMANFIKTMNLSDKFLNNNLKFGTAPDIDKVTDFYNNNRDRFVVNEYQTKAGQADNYYDASENVKAGYLMNKTQLGKLMIIAGVRVERTDVDYRAFRVFRYDQAVINLAANTNKDPHFNGGQVPGKTSTLDAFEKNSADTTLHYTVLLPNMQFKFDITRNTILRMAYTTGYSRPNMIDLVPSTKLNTDLGKVEMG